MQVTKSEAKKVVDEFFHDLVLFVEQMSRKLIDSQKKDEQRLLSKDQEELIHEGSSMGAGIAVGWLGVKILAPLKKRIRTLILLQIVSLALLTAIVAYCWFIMGFERFFVFSGLAISAIGTFFIALVKGFHMYSEIRKNLAEAKKAEIETRQMLMD
jgi:hypothetical protein